MFDPNDNKNYYYATVEELNKNIRTNGTNFRILQHNIRGMNCLDKFERIEEFLTLYRGNIDIVVIGETWIREDHKQLYQIDGYRSIFSCRPDAIGGGLAMYVRSSITFDEIENHHESGYHHIHIRINMSGSPFNVHGVYRPPSFHSTAFLSKLEAIIAVQRSGSSSVVVGDMNIPVNLMNSNITREYTDLLNCYNFTVTNTIPTRPVSNNILDHVICSESVNCAVNETIPTEISDHSMVLSTFNLAKAYEIRTLEKTIINNSRLNEAFQVDVRSIPQGSAEERLVYVINLYNTLKNRFSRKVSVKARIKGYCPWMTFDLWKLIRIKQNILASCRRRPMENQPRELLQHISKKVQQVKIESKKRYYEHLFGQANQKELWRNVNHVMGRKKEDTGKIQLVVNGQLTSDGPTVANSFIQFFSTVGPQLASTIQSRKDINKYNTLNRVNASIFLRPATAQEVIIQIKELDSGKSCGPDGIPASFIKEHHWMFADLLKDVFNECISSGSFPEVLKVARVTPIFKTGNKTDVNNYRPISVLPIISKILEKLLVSRLAQFLHEHKVLYNYQYGFRTGSSTLTATSELVDDIYNAMDSQKMVGVLFLDLKKAFDTIDHHILLQKLDVCGIRGVANDLIQSYLSGRTQFACVNGVSSLRKPLTVGVPQGSNLGPLLFLIYINDLAKMELHGIPRLFADDTSLSYEEKDAEQIIRQMTEDMEKLQGFFAENLLSLNLSKTKYVIFHSSRLRVPPHSDVIVNSTSIDKVEYFKYLGLNLDATLTWNQHIAELRKCISSTCGLLWRISKFLPQKALITMYHAFVQSKLQYLVSIWGAAAKTRLKPLQATQNRCLKVVYKKPRRYHTVDLYCNANASILPIAALRELQCLSQIHNMLHNPRIHHNQILPQRAHSYQLRNPATFVINRPNTEAGKKSVAYYSKTCFNSLPPELKTERIGRKFKEQIKLRIRGRMSDYLL